MMSAPRSQIRKLAAVFFFSGLTGLVYQVAWQRLLTVFLGVGAVSIALIVSVTMFGLGLGSLLGGRLAERSSDPFALYALVEGMLGIAGLVSFPLIFALGRLTAPGPPAAAFACLFVFLCIPTLLMGITLPLLTTIFTRLTGDFIVSVSRLYFINALGAAVGAVLTSYLLVSFLGWNGCIFLAAAVDFVLAAAILSARRKVRPTAKPAEAEAPPVEESSGFGRLAYVLAFFAGFIGIGYEIISYRVIGVLVKDSPYAFSSILAVFLLGLALGGRAIRKFLALHPGVSRRALYFTLQFLTGLSILIIFTGIYRLSKFEPLQSFIRLSFTTDLHPSPALFTSRLGVHSLKEAYLFLDVFLWPLVFLFVPTVLMGAGFPLIASLALRRRGGEGTAVGTTAFFSVLGNVLGGLLTGLVLLSAVGTEATLLAFGSLGLLYGLVRPTREGGLRLSFIRAAAIVLLILGGAAAFPRPGTLYPALHESPFTPNRVHFEEGLDAVVVTYEDGTRLRNFINGQGHGYRPGPFFIAEAVEGLTFAPSPRNILVVGFGAGSIVESALLTDEAQKVTVVELCGSLITNMRKLPEFDRLFNDPKIKVIIDDGRRFLERTEGRFDVVLMDPLRTTTAYSNNVHSRQFFALAAKRLNPGGVLMVGGLGDSGVIARTLLEEFAYVRVYPGFVLASESPLRRNKKRFERLLGSFSPDMRTSIRGFIRDALEGEALSKAVAGVPVNEDWRPVSEYYLGLVLRRGSGGR